MQRSDLRLPGGAAPGPWETDGRVSRRATRGELEARSPRRDAERLPTLAQIAGESHDRAEQDWAHPFLLPSLPLKPWWRGCNSRAANAASAHRAHRGLRFAARRRRPAAFVRISWSYRHLPEVCRGAASRARRRCASRRSARLAAGAGARAAGPRPWIGATCAPDCRTRSGLRAYKTIGIRKLMAALKPAGGTVVALQRNPPRASRHRRPRARPSRARLFPHQCRLEDALASWRSSTGMPG